MAQSSEFDPIAMWQDMLGQWERQVNDMSARLSTSEKFAGPMNRAAKLSLAARQSFDGAMEKFVQSMQLATSAQMQSLIERLDRIEEKVDRIAAVRLTEEAPPSKPSAPPRRTRRPPGGVS